MKVIFDGRKITEELLDNLNSLTEGDTAVFVISDSATLPTTTTKKLLEAPTKINMLTVDSSYLDIVVPLHYGLCLGCGEQVKFITAIDEKENFIAASKVLGINLE